MHNTIIQQLQDNRDFLEELKCLFLRVQNPKKGVFEDMVRQIFNCRLNSFEGVSSLKVATKFFGDSQNKFLDNLEKKINEFNVQRVR